MSDDPWADGDVREITFRACEECGASGMVDAGNADEGTWSEGCRTCSGIGYVKDDGTPAYEISGTGWLGVPIDCGPLREDR